MQVYYFLVMICCVNIFTASIVRLVKASKLIRQKMTHSWEMRVRKQAEKSRFLWIRAPRRASQTGAGY